MLCSQSLEQDLWHVRVHTREGEGRGSWITCTGACGSPQGQLASARLDRACERFARSSSLCTHTIATCDQPTGAGACDAHACQDSNGMQAALSLQHACSWRMIHDAAVACWSVMPRPGSGMLCVRLALTRGLPASTLARFLFRLSPVALCRSCKHASSGVQALSIRPY